MFAATATIAPRRPACGKHFSPGRYYYFFCVRNARFLLSARVVFFFTLSFQINHESILDCGGNEYLGNSYTAISKHVLLSLLLLCYAKIWRLLIRQVREMIIMSLASCDFFRLTKRLTQQYINTYVNYLYVFIKYLQFWNKVKMLFYTWTSINPAFSLIRQFRYSGLICVGSSRF